MGSTHFDQIANEISQGDIDRGLWIEALAVSGGDEQTARARYIKLRARKLRSVGSREQPRNARRAPRKSGVLSVLLDTAGNVAADLWTAWLWAWTFAVRAPDRRRPALPGDDALSEALRRRRAGVAVTYGGRRVPGLFSLRARGAATHHPAADHAFLHRGNPGALRGDLAGVAPDESGDSRAHPPGAQFRVGLPGGAVSSIRGTRWPMR